MPSNQSTRPGDVMADLADSLLHSPKDTRSHTTAQQSSSTSQDNNTNNTKSANRGMSSTNNWKPALDRRQSWNAQEYKHDVLSRQYGLGGGEGQQREGAERGVRKGFSEV